MLYVKIFLYFMYFFMSNCLVQFPYEEVDRRRSPLKPLGWALNPVTKTYIWEGYTTKEEDYGTSSTGRTEEYLIFLAIFLPAVLLCIILATCKYFFCNKSSNNSSNRTLHIPPRNITNARGNGTEPVTVHRMGAYFVSRAHPTMFVHEGTNIGANTNSSTPRNFATQLSFDAPPVYSTVITSDSSKSDTRFPVDSLDKLETPPPIYNEENKPRF